MSQPIDIVQSSLPERELLVLDAVDPAASVLIGVLLAFVAVLLGRETGALLVGERTNRTRIRNMKQIISDDPEVKRVCELLTMRMGPQHALLTVEIRFRRTLDIQQLESAISRINMLDLQTHKLTPLKITGLN